jgi:DNA sulfur modification protein DndB
MDNDQMVTKFIIPALRAYMGDWIYYITLLKMRDIAKMITIAEQIHESRTLNELIQRRLTSRARPIRDYILTQPQRFFNSLVIGVYGGAPQWYDLAIRENQWLDPSSLPPYINESLGILVFDGTEKLFAIDGQHRVMGIKEAIEKDASRGNEEVSALFVAHKNDSTGLERTRRLFTTLNRYAKPVSQKDIIALDEDDIVAITTRSLVENYPLFIDKISIAETRNIPPNDKQSLTSIEVLYDAMDSYLRDRSQGWAAFKRVRPSDRDIARYYQKATKFWDLLGEYFRPIAELKVSAPSANVAGKYRNNRGGHLLFRPVGLLVVVDVLQDLMRTTRNLRQVMNRISRAPMDLSKKPWAGLLWDTSNMRMITTPENQKVARRLLFYSVGGDLRQLRTTPSALEKEYAGILRLSVDEVDLPKYVRKMPSKHKA